MQWTSAAAILAVALAPGLRAQPSPAAPAPRAPQSAPHTHPTRPAEERFVVLLDPAHGGKDAGALLSNPSAKAYAAPRQVEKDATLEFAEALRAALADKGVAARLTRSDDATLSDDDRAAQGSSLGAGICISLHATAVGAGVHVFYPMTQFGLLNHSFLDQWTSADATPSRQSQPLARAVAASLANAQIPVTTEPAAGPVISREHCPALAIELAPLRSEYSAALTGADPQYQRRVAAAVAQAILEWRDQRQALDAGAAAYGRKMAR